MKLPLSIVVFSSSLASAGCSGSLIDENSKKPEIVEVFACSDYCPGPDEKYMKRVYEGVVDEEECRKLDGRLYSFIGWGQHFVCEVK